MTAKVLAFPKRSKRARKSQMRVALERLSEERTSVLAVEHARALLAEAKDLGDVAELRDQAAAMAHYARARAAGSQAYADAWEIVQLATRRIGELTASLPKATAGRKPNLSAGEQISTQPKQAVIASLGLTRPQVARAEKLAALPETEFRARVELGRARITKQAEPDAILAASAAAGYDGDEYGTPENWLEPARELLGGIDFDPASNAAANNIVRARRFCTKADSSLKRRHWKCRTIWLNPPFSADLICEFAPRLVTEWQAQHFEAGLCLTNADATGWYNVLLHASNAHCVPDKRIAFLLNGTPIKQNRYTQTLFYFGEDLEGFHRLYSPLGTICVRYEGSP